ncbi:TetR/AcrR family transcriptional regulator [Sphingobacterium rhinopitheci]|uniref:TetR/AcrR family transcriptional regulator n=1 Tax=Sphingobacterium rhinopitheci TaxID=2781960 RepID=UPI001F522EE1|nr:TetR/AcrR family transcriptional regulator [Sphingobacterium rhinopitheci]MCI0922056.1 TetR/AcrR family transcriptional regulator [Sphingobacterium rhinopitheci]
MDKRKEGIIEVALKRFCHYGFSKTTMNEIADDLRITKANLYYYYQDKSALISDVIRHVANDLNKQEQDFIVNYNHDFLGTLFGMLELRSNFLSKYYMLHINENLEWIKGVEIQDLFLQLRNEEVQKLKSFFSMAVECGDVKIDDLDEVAQAFYEVNKAIGIMYNVHDIISGIPNKENVEMILASQKRIAKLIFEDKIVTN